MVPKIWNHFGSKNWNQNGSPRAGFFLTHGPKNDSYIWNQNGSKNWNQNGDPRAHFWGPHGLVFPPPRFRFLDTRGVLFSTPPAAPFSNPPGVTFPRGRGVPFQPSQHPFQKPLRNHVPCSFLTPRSGFHSFLRARFAAQAPIIFGTERQMLVHNRTV